MSERSPALMRVRFWLIVNGLVSFVLFVPTVSGGIHPTQKPVELCEYLIRTYTRPGELVADICAGSGTTAIAAINTERRLYALKRPRPFMPPPVSASVRRRQ